jgi:hypothetical protein
MLKSPILFFLLAALTSTALAQLQCGTQLKDGDSVTLPQQ